MPDSDHNTTGQAPETEGLTERTKTLLQNCDHSTLATQSLKHPGFPFASVVPYALDNQGRPVFLISSMATHTKNLKADDRACLLVEDNDAGDRLAGARVSVIGKIAPIAEQPPEDILQASEAYLAKHPNAKQWASFGDFAWCRLEVEDIYVVAGFGSMGWVNSESYTSLFRE